LKKNTFNWRVNHQIRASELRVISGDGKQLGVISLQDALRKAEEEGLDLIEVAPNAKPPVARIVELGKFRYLEEKRQQKEKRGSKSGDTKEIRLSPFIAEHDLENRLARINEFLKERNKVRLVVRFKGREMGSKQFGYNLLGKVKSRIETGINIDMEPKFLGRNLMMVVSPSNKIKVERQEVKEDTK